jgi:hypothetical protein
MQMPGFTAGASLYKAKGQYYMYGASNQVGAAILPALGAGNGGDCFDNCTTRCDNLEGAAQQRCVDRCSHICFPTGPSTGPNNPSFDPCDVAYGKCSLGCTDPACLGSCFGRWVFYTATGICLF